MKLYRTIPLAFACLLSLLTGIAAARATAYSHEQPGISPRRWASPFRTAIHCRELSRQSTPQSSSSPPIIERNSEPQRLSLPSAVPTDALRNATIWIDYFPAHVAAGRHAPAVVLLHPLGNEFGTYQMMCRIGRYLAAHGISAAVMMLPYHLLRCPLGDFPARHYLSADSRTVQQTFAQARSDVSTVVTWLISQPETDSTRIGIFGISLGAIVTHLAMGTDSRINAGVAALGGGDMPYLARSSILFRMNHPGHAPGLLPGDINRLDSVDPLTSAAANQPRHVLMIQAARDSIIPPRSATELWEALGKPPITWVDTGHFMAQADQDGLMRTALDYFATTWSLPNAPKQMRTSLNPPTVTVGLAFGPATGVTPEISWLAIPIGRKADHTTLLHLDLGLGFCGPFADLAITLHPLIDLGYAHNLISGTEGLYVSLHVTL